MRQAVGGFRHDLPHTADLELWLRMAAAADIGRVIGPVQAFRRIHGASMMQRDYADALVDLRERKRAFDAFFSTAGSTIRGAENARRTAARRLAAEAIENSCQHMAAGGRVDVMADYIRFAHDAYSDVAKLPAWAEYRLRIGNADGPLIDVRRHSHAVRRNLEARWRYRRWLLAGV